MPVRGTERRPLYNHLRGFREEAGLSRARLAEIVEVNVQTIGALERGRYSPSLYLALLIAEALGRPVDEIFGLADSPGAVSGDG